MKIDEYTLYILAVSTLLVGTVLGFILGVLTTDQETVMPNNHLYPFLECQEDEVWTYEGDYPADLLQYGCIPLDDLVEQEYESK